MLSALWNSTQTHITTQARTSAQSYAMRNLTRRFYANANTPQEKSDRIKSEIKEAFFDALKKFGWVNRGLKSQQTDHRYPASPSCLYISVLNTNKDSELVIT